MESGKRQGALGTRYEEGGERGGWGGMRDGRQANCDRRYSCKRRKPEERVVIGYITRDGLLNISQSKRELEIVSVFAEYWGRGTSIYFLYYFQLNS